MESTFEIDGKRFRLKTWTAEQVEQIETALECRLLDLAEGLTHRAVYTIFYVCVRGQSGIDLLTDARAFVTLRNRSVIDNALAPFLTEALVTMHNLVGVFAGNGEAEGVEVVTAHPLGLPSTDAVS